MVRIPNSAFVNACSNRREGVLFDPECPFRTPDDAYKAWLAFLRCDEGRKICNECNGIAPILTIMFQSGGFFVLERSSYSRVIFVRIPESRNDVALVIEVCDATIPLPTFTDVTFDGVRLIIDYLVTTPGVILPSLNFDGTIRFINSAMLIVTDQASDITGPIIRNRHRDDCDCGADKCNKTNGHDRGGDSCGRSGGNCKVPTNAQRGQGFVSNPNIPSQLQQGTGFSTMQSPQGISFAQPQVPLSNLSYSGQQAVGLNSLSALQGGSNFPVNHSECDPRPTTLPVPFIPTTAQVLFNILPGTVFDLYGAILVVSVSSFSSITPIIVFLNRGSFRGFFWRITGNTVVFVKNVGGSVLLETQQTINVTGSFGLAQFNVSDPIQSAIVETTNTNVTTDGFKVQVGTVTTPGVGPFLFQHQIRPNLDLPNFYLFKLIVATGLTLTLAEVTGLITFYNSLFVGNTGIQTGRPTLNIYLTNTTLYTASLVVKYNILLYGLGTNITGPLFVLDDGSSPIWNGSLTILPVILTCDYIHTRGDGTIFYIDASHGNINRHNPSAPYVSAQQGGKGSKLSGRQSESKEERVLTITLPCETAWPGRIFEYVRIDDNECARVILKTDRGRFRGQKSRVISLRPFETIRIQYYCGDYLILSRYEAKQEYCDDKSDSHHRGHGIALGAVPESQEETPRIKEQRVHREVVAESESDRGFKNGSKAAPVRLYRVPKK